MNKTPQEEFLDYVGKLRVQIEFNSKRLIPSKGFDAFKIEVANKLGAYFNSLPSVGISNIDKKDFDEVNDIYVLVTLFNSENDFYKSVDSYARSLADISAKYKNITTNKVPLPYSAPTSNDPAAIALATDRAYNMILRGVNESGYKRDLAAVDKLLADLKSKISELSAKLQKSSNPADLALMNQLNDYTVLLKQKRDNIYAIVSAYDSLDILKNMNINYLSTGNPALIPQFKIIKEMEEKYYIYKFDNKQKLQVIQNYADANFNTSEKLKEPDKSISQEDSSEVDKNMSKQGDSNQVNKSNVSYQLTIEQRTELIEFLKTASGNTYTDDNYKKNIYYGSGAERSLYDLMKSFQSNELPKDYSVVASCLKLSGVSKELNILKVAVSDQDKKTQIEKINDSLHISKQAEKDFKWEENSKVLNFIPNMFRKYIEKATIESNNKYVPPTISSKSTDSDSVDGEKKVEEKKTEEEKKEEEEKKKSR